MHAKQISRESGTSRCQRRQISWKGSHGNQWPRNQEERESYFGQLLLLPPSLACKEIETASHSSGERVSADGWRLMQQRASCLQCLLCHLKTHRHSACNERPDCAVRHRKGLSLADPIRRLVRSSRVANGLCASWTPLNLSDSEFDAIISPKRASAYTLWWCRLDCRRRVVVAAACEQ